MRPLLIWLGIALTTFGAVAGGAHLYLSASPHRLLVVVDSSYAMQARWTNVKCIVEKLGGERYTEYALLTEKSRIHGWAPRIDLGKLLPYGPRDLSRLLGNPGYSEIREADEKHLITNAGSADTAPFEEDGWRVVPPVSCGTG